MNTFLKNHTKLLQSGLRIRLNLSSFTNQNKISLKRHMSKTHQTVKQALR